MTTVVSVRFRSGCKTYYCDPKDLTVEAGQDVIVETAQGPEFAQCCEGNHAVPDEQVVPPLRAVLRIATDNDRHTAAYNRSREKDAFDICQKKILQHKLEMKLVRVECSFDGSKILFFFTADGRVDFRELVKDLAGVFRARIELRQIGVRDEAKMLGGLGICGRPFCCSQFMDEFLPVSIKMAKTQSLSLNPTKISGTCGRLMCCLKYEQDAYEDAIKRMPKNDSFVLTPDGPGNVSDVNLLKETVNVRLDDRPEGPRCYHNCEVCVLRNQRGNGVLSTVRQRVDTGHRQHLRQGVGGGKGRARPCQHGDVVGVVAHADHPVLRDIQQRGKALHHAALVGALGGQLHQRFAAGHDLIVAVPRRGAEIVQQRRLIRWLCGEQRLADGGRHLRHAVHDHRGRVGHMEVPPQRCLR